MRFDEILTKAGSLCSRPNDDGSPWVRVSGSPEQAAAAFVALKSELGESGKKPRVFLSGPFGCYDLEPILSVSKPGRPTVLYCNVTPSEASKLVTMI